MDEPKNRNKFTMAESRWVTGYGVGDLVKIENKYLGVVARETQLDQELMFPFVPVYIFKNQKIIEFQTNSLEIVSKA